MFKRLFVSLGFIFIVFFAWFFISTRPVTYKETQASEFEIKSGWNVDKIGQELSNAKLIRSRSTFKISVVVMGIANKIQAGFFKISPNMTVTEIAAALTKASVKQVRVTIPEGLRRQEIALIIEKAFAEVEGETYSSTEFLSQTEDKEGKLFPDTYDFDAKSTTSVIVGRLENRYKEILNELKISEKDQNKITILASLLERESASADEMPEIAGVIENRLAQKWPLQIDATVQYAISTTLCRTTNCNWWPKNLTRVDLQINSPYNTYQNQGLPPKPICNPGKAAIKAAASPKETPYWFYLHDSKGLIHFAKTVEEHNANVCNFLQKDCVK